MSKNSHWVAICRTGTPPMLLIAPISILFRSNNQEGKELNQLSDELLKHVNHALRSIWWAIWLCFLEMWVNWVYLKTREKGLCFCHEKGKLSDVFFFPSSWCTTYTESSSIISFGESCGVNFTPSTKARASNQLIFQSLLTTLYLATTGLPSHRRRIHPTPPRFVFSHHEASLFSFHIAVGGASQVKDAVGMRVSNARWKLTDGHDAVDLAPL